MRWLIAIVLLTSAIGGCTSQCLGSEDFSRVSHFEKVSDENSLSISQLPAPTLTSESFYFSTERNQIEYRGLESVIVNRGISYASKYFQATQDNVWIYGQQNLAEFQDWQRNQLDLSHDFQYGAWWNRSWRESLVTAPKKPISVIGQEIEMVNWEEVSVSNTGKVKLGDLQFYLDKISPKIADLWTKPTFKETSTAFGIKLGGPTKYSESLFTFLPVLPTEDHLKLSRS